MPDRFEKCCCFLENLHLYAVQDPLEICITNMLSVRIIQGHVLTGETLTVYGSSFHTRVDTDATCNI